MKKKLKYLPLFFLFPITMSFSSDKKKIHFFLEECPNKPNCVISLEKEKDSSHYIEPIHFPEKNLEKTKKNLVQAIEKLGGTIVEETPFYIKSEFFSNFFQFKDISEFIIIPEKNLILIRSGAVTGYYDFGVNRKRMEKIRESMN